MKKTRFISKFIMLFLFLSFSILQANAQKVTLSFKNVPFEKVLNSIKQQTKLSLVFSEQLVDLNRKVTIDVTSLEINEVLKQLLAGTNIDFEIKNNKLYLIEKKDNVKDNADIKGQKKLTGLVTDEKGEPIIGANITIKGLNTGTISDINGNYQIQVDPNTILRFSYIGYQTQEIVVGQNTSLSVSLIENNKTLDEIVVVGYGTKKKRDVIGSVATVKTDELNRSGSLSAINNLQGKASGLSISSSAAGNKVRVRGVHSINSGNDPLWVVDGIPSSPPNSDEIESIEILKDASATAIYGSRGSNGVIIVTTKRGKEGKTDLNFNIQSGVNLITKTDVDMGYATNKQWFDIMDMATTNSDVSAFDPMNILNADVRFKTTDITADEARLVRDNWFDAVTRPGNYINAALSLSTGTKNGTTYMNANIKSTEGNILSNKNNDVNFRINSDYKVNKVISVGGKLLFTRSEQNGDGSSTIRLAPWQPLYYSLDPERTGYWNPHSNPLTALDPKYKQLKSDNLRILGGIYGEIALPFVKGLSIRSEYNANIYVNNYTNWQSALVNPVTASEAGSRATEQSITGQKNSANGYLKYNNTFGFHTISGVVGAESERTTAYLRMASGKNLTTEYAQLGTTPGELMQAQGYVQSENYMLSVFGRADYKYADKYLAGISFRRDGSSLFAPEYRWGTFTAYSLGWIMSEEKFLKEYSWIDLIKLRGSMGQTGNNSIPQNKNLTTFDMNVEYGYGEESVVSGGKKPATIGNNSLTWETTSSYDIGLDYGLFNNRLTGSVAYYFQDVNGLVLAASVPKSTGLSGTQEIWGNMGEIYNSGFEFNVSSINIDTKDFKWSTDFNISTSQNKVVKLTETLDSKGIPIYHDGNRVVGLVSKTGGMVREFYMPEYAGVDPERGVEMIYELDKAKFDETGETTRTGRLVPATQGNLQNNRFYLNGKTINPTFYGGISNTFTYKNFDLNFLINYSGGNYIYDHEMALMSTPSLGKTGLYADLIERSWKQPGDVANYPRLVYNATQPFDWDSEVLNPSSPTGKGDWKDNTNGNYSIQYGSHSKYLYKGDYLKLKHVELGYSLDETIMTKLGMKSFRVYVAADNLYTLTAYPGWDPESGFIRGGIVGLDSSTLNPFLVTATFLAGLQLKF